MSQTHSPQSDLISDHPLLPPVRFRPATTTCIIMTDTMTGIYVVFISFYVLNNIKRSPIKNHILASLIIKQSIQERTKNRAPLLGGSGAVAPRASSSWYRSSWLLGHRPARRQGRSVGGGACVRHAPPPARQIKPGSSRQLSAPSSAMVAACMAAPGRAVSDCARARMAPPPARIIPLVAGCWL